MFVNRSFYRGYLLTVRDLGELEALLRSSGLRVTQPRLAVLVVLERASSHGAHLTVAQVVDRVREIEARVSPQTAYRCLEALVAAGIAGRVDLPGSPALFEAATPTPHDHLVCERCGAVTNVHGRTSAAERLEVDDAGGARVLAADLVLRGLCRACAGR